MPDLDLRGIDLNLLVVLDALLDERHVTRAAQRVGLSQPAASNALKRLRRLLNDPILVRDGNRMELTARAEQAQEPLRRALESLRLALENPEPFTPARFQGVVRIAATDHVMIVLLPRVQEIVAREAPGLSLQIGLLGTLDPTDLSRGEVDIAIGTFARRLNTRLRRQALFAEGMTCLLRHGHPALVEGPSGPTLDLETFLSYPHLKVGMIPDDPGAVGAALAKLGRERTVACQVPSFLAAPFIVQRTDLVVVIPRRVANTFSQLLDLPAVPPPVTLGTFTTEMVWHARLDDSPPQIWIRDTIRNVSESLTKDEAD